MRRRCRKLLGKFGRGCDWGKKKGGVGLGKKKKGVDRVKIPLAFNGIVCIKCLKKNNKENQKFFKTRK